MGTTSGQATVDTTGEYLIDRSGITSTLRNGVDGVVVGCITGSTSPALVHVDGIHADDEFAYIPAGQQISFRRPSRSITRVFAKGSGGNATVYATVSELNTV